jgi:hypothetical protein
MDVCHSADNSFTVNHVLSAERTVLQTLCWKLAYPTCMDFLIAFASVCELDMNGPQFYTYSFFLELSVRTPSYHNYSPAFFAGATVVLANYYTNNLLREDKSLWPSDLEQSTGIGLTDLVTCAYEISFYFENQRQVEPLSFQNMTRFRYGEDWHDVSIPFVASERFLLDYEERVSINNTDNLLG